MTACCTGVSGQANRQRLVCPENGRDCPDVGATTLLHQLARPWLAPLQGRRFAFCADPGCAVVYFDDAGTTYNGQALRGPVGQKSRDPERVVCYCFDMTHDELDADPSLRAFIVAQTRADRCACQVRNPSGRCCLGDVARAATG